MKSISQGLYRWFDGNSVVSTFFDHLIATVVHAVTHSRFLIHVIGKARRFWLVHFKKQYVHNQLLLRQGDCGQCGFCCNLLFTCPMLTKHGKMNLEMVIFCGTLGSLLGAVFNYWIALKFGRPFFEKYGKYLLVSPGSLEKADRFFERHGHISTFIGRLLPESGNIFHCRPAWRGWAFLSFVRPPCWARDCG